MNYQQVYTEGEPTSPFVFRNDLATGEFSGRKNMAQLVSVNFADEKMVIAKAISAPAVAYGEKLSDALRSIRALIESRAGQNATFKNRRQIYGEEDGDTRDVLVLTCRIKNASPEHCADLSDAAIEHIISNVDPIVSGDIAVEVYPMNG